MFGFWKHRRHDHGLPDTERRDRAREAEEDAGQQLEARRRMWPKTRADSAWARGTVDANHLSDLFNNRGGRRHA